MASIQTALTLTDHVSAPLQQMNNMLHITMNSFRQINVLCNDFSNTSGMESIREDIDSMRNSMDRFVEATEDARRSQEDLQDATATTETLSSRLISSIKGKASELLSIDTLSKAFNMADGVSNTETKISNMNDGMQTTAALQDMIFESAQRARTSYSDMQQTVAALGNSTSGIFASSGEVVAFTEQLNKQFALSGNSAEEAAGTTEQIVQALSLGTIGGDELNSILQQTPSIVESIANYMRVPTGAIAQMADEGKLSGEVIKNSLLAATDETNAKFGELPTTFGQIWSSFQNSTKKGFEPVFQKLTEIASSPEFANMVNGISEGIVVVAAVITEVFDSIVELGSLLYDNWSTILPIILAVVGVYALYSAILAICSVIQGIATIKDSLRNIVLGRQNRVVAEATVAQTGLNAALLASPAMMILLIVLAIIGVLYLVIAVINKVAGTSISATGIICGVFSVAAAFIGNIILTLINIVIDIFVVLWNFIAAFVNFFANVFNDPVGAIARLFFDLVDGILELLQGLASAIDTLFGSSLADSVQGWRGDLQGWVDNTFGKGEEVMKEIDAKDWRIDKRIEYGAAWDAGYGFGDNLTSNLDLPKEDDITDDTLNNSVSPYNESMLGGNSIPGNVSDTADNTAAIEDSMEITSQDLKYIKDMAERDIINRFTTAEINVDMTNNNTIKNDMDLDGISEKLKSRIEQEMHAVAEGVH